MTDKSKKFFAGFVVVTLAILLLGLVAAGSYWIGRKSIQPEEMADQISEAVAGQQIGTATQEKLTPVDSSNDDGEAVQSKPATPTDQPAEDGQSAQDSQPRGDLELDQEDLDLVIEVWDIVNQEFDGDLPNEDEVTYEAIIGSLELLDDQFTRFVPPEIAERAREQLEGSFEGIGAFVDLTDDGYLLIVRPIQDQPADLAGLRAGDIVTQVNGEPVLGKSLEAIIAEVKGPEGTEVTLTIRREGEPDDFDVTIVRELIEIPIVETQSLENDIAYVRLTAFSGNASEQLFDALTSLLKEETRALILDLRDNPGGFLSQSVEVADLFLPEGVVLYQRDSDGEEEIFESDNGDIAEEIPLVVLVNAGSASASEIVAGAVKDRERGILIGEATFGKGSVQQTHTLSDGSELRVTIARWYTPNDNSIDDQGIAPDIIVLTPDEFGGENDTQLQEAIDYILSLQ
jgi:carboxyl-terminal processing protease